MLYGAFDKISRRHFVFKVETLWAIATSPSQGCRMRARTTVSQWQSSLVTAHVNKAESVPTTGDGLNTGVFGLADFVGQYDSYGITSDPLTQFAVVFSAIIHDIQHPGIPNAQMATENNPLAAEYTQSTAEQNSIHIAWDMLMKDDFKDLRACIYKDETELRRFRQLLANEVMARDICDIELVGLRKERWAKAFSGDKLLEHAKPQVGGAEDDDTSQNQRATIVIEHLIQASDVSHTMQHCHIFRMWNQRLFNELYTAYLQGRMATDPSKGWADGEFGFFDFYIIPLAKKLDTCGVFGVSGQEYLAYAQSNRDEWKAKGKDIVQEYLAAFEGKGVDPPVLKPSFPGMMIDSSEKSFHARA